MKSAINYIIIVFAIVIIAACKSEPKVITAQKDSTNSEKVTGVFSEEPSSDGHVHSTSSVSEDMHTVIAKKVLPTTKYVYILVQEGDNEFWIATNKQEIRINNTYFYRDGILKTNFESKEHNKVFDKIFLVSKLVAADHGNNSATPVNTNPGPSEKIEKKGSIKIADLVANPKNYSGKLIQVSGKCVKLNPNIMGRNWIHLNDGSISDYDLVVTSATAVPIGHNVTMTGMVVLDKDFGSGYLYDILIENGTIVK